MASELFKNLSTFVKGLETYQKNERQAQYSFISQLRSIDILARDEAVVATLDDFEFLLKKIDAILECSEEMSAYDLVTMVGPYFEKLAQCHSYLTLLAGNYMGLQGDWY